MTTMKNIIIAGQAAEGAGALVGWRGRGALSLDQIVAALVAAGCPADWAPRPESCKAHAGEAIRALNGEGYIVRSAVRSDQDRRLAKATGRTWDARWYVARSAASTANVGESAGQVLVTFELHGEELVASGDTELAARVIEVFRAKRDTEAFESGRVTEWLARTLQNHLGCTTLGLGWYIPSGSRTLANALCVAMSTRWGHSWICPALPVADSDELRIGIARGLEDDVRAIEKTLANERAQRDDKREISEAVAARLLRSVGELAERVSAYRALCGNAVDAAVSLIKALTEDLARIADATSIRGSLLELAEPPAPPLPPEVSPAERAADVAAAMRQAAARANDPVATSPTTHRVSAPPTVELADVIDPKADNSDLERASLLEWD